MLKGAILYETPYRHIFIPFNISLMKSFDTFSNAARRKNKIAEGNFVFEEGKLGLWKKKWRFFAAKFGQVSRTFAT